MNDPLGTLNWLVEAGVDEANADQPVNRMAAKSSPPLEGWPKLNPRSGDNFGQGTSANRKSPSPKMPSAFSTLPPGEGHTMPLVPGDAIGGAMAAAGAATTLAELKAAMEA